MKIISGSLEYRKLIQLPNFVVVDVHDLKEFNREN